MGLNLGKRCVGDWAKLAFNGRTEHGAEGSFKDLGREIGDVVRDTMADEELREVGGEVIAVAGEEASDVLAS